jgi:hypothetical protein
MAKRSTAKPHDFMAVPRRVVEEAIGEKLDSSPLPKKTRRAVGGVKGGRARAAKLNPQERATIARKSGAGSMEEVLAFEATTLGRVSGAT